MKRAAREIALNALISFRREGSWPDLYLKRECEGLQPEEAALASTIAYGTLQNRMLIDFYLSCFSAKPLKQITPQVLDALRIAVYQMLFLNRIPHSAAVNESVELVKKTANPGAASFANAVLRNISRNAEHLPPIPEEDPLTALSIRYSHPRWFVGKMEKRLGQAGCAALLQANNEPAPLVARINTLKTSRDAAISALQAEGIHAEPHPYLENAILLDKMKGVVHSKPFQSGWLYIQDTASQLCVAALQPQPGSTVIDMCAAPGGKSILACQYMECKGSILSIDLYPHKTDLIDQNAQRYGAHNLQTITADATKRVQPLEMRADAIICDVPCSGMGIIRKKPDIRYKDGDSIKSLPPLQLAILKNAAAYLKPGGHLVYSTCTVLKEENEGVIQAFLADAPAFALEPFSLPCIGAVDDGMITLWPHVHGTDGFFMARLKKQ